MPARKKIVNDTDQKSPNLTEVLSDGGDTIYGGYSDVNGMDVVRLIHAISSLGGMVTFWVDSPNQRICFSMRVWGGHKSYNIDEPSQFGQHSEPIVSKLTPHMQKNKAAPLPTRNADNPPVKQKE